MTAPAPLEIYISRSDVANYHYAQIYDPGIGQTLITAREVGYEAALKRLLWKKDHSKLARRKYVIKSNRSATVLGLLELIERAEETMDAETGDGHTHITLASEGVRLRLCAAIAELEGHNT